MIKGIINERCLKTSSMHMWMMWQFKNGWVTQFTNDMVRSLFRQQIIETTTFYLIYFEKTVWPINLVFRTVQTNRSYCKNPNNQSCQKYSKSTLLNCLNTIAVFDRQTAMPDRACIFKNWSDNSSVEMISIIRVHRATFQLFQEINTRGCFVTYGTDMVVPLERLINMNTQKFKKH